MYAKGGLIAKGRSLEARPPKGLLKQGIRANYDINKLVERAKKIAGISK